RIDRGYHFGRMCSCCQPNGNIIERATHARRSCSELVGDPEDSETARVGRKRITRLLVQVIGRRTDTDYSQFDVALIDNCGEQRARPQSVRLRKPAAYEYFLVSTWQHGAPARDVYRVKRHASATRERERHHASDRRHVESGDVEPYILHDTCRHAVHTGDRCQPDSDGVGGACERRKYIGKATADVVVACCRIQRARCTAECDHRHDTAGHDGRDGEYLRANAPEIASQLARKRAHQDSSSAETLCALRYESEMRPL